MKPLLITSLLALATALPHAASASDPSVTIAVGQPDRGYEARGYEIAKKLAQRKILATVVNFEGSDDISIAVCSGEAQAGIMQIDAIYRRSKEGCDMQKVVNYGDEYAFILFPPDSPYNALDDLPTDAKVLTDTLGSGTYLFWETIVEIEKEYGNGSAWSKATQVEGLTMLADAMAAGGDIDAVVLVGNPNSPEVHELMSAGWNPGEFSDKDINDMQFSGKPLYNRESVKFDPAGAFNSDRERAYVVPSFIVANKEWMASDRKAFAEFARSSR